MELWLELHYIWVLFSFPPFPTYKTMVIFIDYTVHFQLIQDSFCLIQNVHIYYVT